MLLAIDVGNTQTVIGLFDGDKLCEHWRVSTDPNKTGDELAIILADLLSLVNLGLKDISAVIISSVVPNLTSAFGEMSEQILKLKPLIVGPGIKTGVSILYDQPREVGADRIANAVAAYELYGGPTIVVDFGTATTFDVISKDGEYLGGVIAPGIEISANALFAAAAKLSRVEIIRPERVVGKNTAESIQSGIIYGTVGQVDGIVNRLKKELAGTPKVIATGGLAELIVSECQTVDSHEPMLTLVGLRLIYEKNR